MTKLLKPSMFNYITYNRNEDMLLYNAFVGCNSFSKVKKEDCKKIEQILSDSCIVNSDEQIIKNLVNRGFLVDFEVDEKKTLKYKALEFVCDNLLHLTIFTTGQCNFRCKYCCEDFAHPQMSKDAQQRIIQFIEKNIRLYKGVQIDWFGGEPLLGYSAIENISREVIRICKVNRKPYVASITSNGYCLNEETFRRLLKMHVLYYTITIDGVEETHDFFRSLASGAPSFVTIIKNLLDIRNNCKSASFHFNIRTNFTQEMYSNINSYIDFFSDLFSDTRFSFFIKHAMDWGGDSIKNIKNSLIEEDGMQQIYQKFVDNDKIKNFNVFRAYYEFGGCVCSAGQMNGYVLDTFANVYKCSRIYLPGLQIGTITNKGVMKLEKQKTYDWLNPCVCPKENIQFCKNDSCIFQPICLFESCGKKRVFDDDNIEPQCPSEIVNIHYIFQLLDLMEQNFKLLSC